VTHRVDADVLVVEGWVAEYSWREAASEFKRGKYQFAFTTGGPLPGEAGDNSGSKSWAAVGARRLKVAGVPGEFIQMIPARVVGRDRTYSSAMALRDWFHERNMCVHSINVVTQDAHARRIRLLFQQALDKQVTVGIISVPNPDYDPKHWWRYSEGVREIFGSFHSRYRLPFEMALLVFTGVTIRGAVERLWKRWIPASRQLRDDHVSHVPTLLRKV
jgi:uncharacterized SAM-binding protein YcdF (DUF218 family)